MMNTMAFSVMESPGVNRGFLYLFVHTARWLSVIVLLVLGTRAGFTQANQSRAARADGVYDAQFGIVSEMHADVETLGSEYLETEWLKTDIYLKPTVYPSILVIDLETKLDLLAGVLEIKTATGSRVVEPTMLDSFVWKKSDGKEKFIALLNRAIDGKTRNVFAKVLVEDKVQLLEISYAWVKQAYNDKLAMGNRVQKIHVSRGFYIQKQGNIYRIKGKQLYRLFPEREHELKSFTKTNHLDLRKAADLVALMEYYDTL
ncbi:MAG: hypothetical protein U0U09_11180 [Cyclobacteriaceae bacterium]